MGHPNYNQPQWWTAHTWGVSCNLLSFGWPVDPPPPSCPNEPNHGVTNDTKKLRLSRHRNWTTSGVASLDRWHRIQVEAMAPCNRLGFPIRKMKSYPPGKRIHIPPNGKAGQSSTQNAHFLGGYVNSLEEYPGGLWHPGLGEVGFQVVYAWKT